MSRRIKIVADDKIPFLKGVLEPFAEVEYYKGSEIDNNKVKNADALIIRTRTICDSQLLNNTNIQLITTATIGYDHIDTEYCLRNNIKWVNAPGCNSSSVKQYIASALFTCAAEMDFELNKKTIGIIGVGNVGRKVADLCSILGMKVLLNDPPRERQEGSANFVSVDTLKAESDIITFHVPLSKTGDDKTYHMANEEFFSGLRQGTIIINTSRGPVVKSSALKKSIPNKSISYTVLDVWEDEPGIDEELLDSVNIGTPHIAGYSADGKANGTAVCVNAVRKHFNMNMPGWYPNDIPLPSNSVLFEPECNSGNYFKVLHDIILHTYNIREDDSSLRASPDKFEWFRDHYPVRREYPLYKIRLSECCNSLSKKLNELGFLVESKER